MASASIEHRDTRESEFRPSSSARTPTYGMIGNSQAIRRVREMIRRVAATDGTILITGETGTGKELAARAVHMTSPRSARNLVAVNCAAIPDALFESEVFGYERGAFTGAGQRQDGLLKMANGGTLFLDEIGEMSALAQAKILRAIEHGEVRPLGAEKPIKVDFRLIAATHRNLGALVQRGTFRRDLFFRLNVVPIYLPPLRERREDIQDLVQHFLHKFNARSQRKVDHVTPAAMRFLSEQEWPGNVRELLNTLEAAFTLCGEQTAELDLKSFRWNRAATPAINRMIASPSLPHESVCSEPQRLLSALQVTRWNKKKAAELLQCSRMTVYRKIQTYGLSRSDGKSSDGLVKDMGAERQQGV